MRNDAARIPRADEHEPEHASPRQRAGLAAVDSSEPDAPRRESASPYEWGSYQPRRRPGSARREVVRARSAARVATSHHSATVDLPRPVPRGGEPGRRTVEIRGQVTPPRRRRSSAEAAFAARPDRAALWAFLLALFMVLMAVATAHAAV